MNQTFNKYQFAEILKTAQGGRTQAEFAADAGISITHMSKLLNAGFNNPPRPTTIYKIAAAIDNLDQIKLLYGTAGLEYQNQLHTFVSSKKNKTNHNPFPVNDIDPFLENFLQNSKFRWDHSYGYCVTDIKILEEPIKRWLFYNDFLYEEFFRHYNFDLYVNKIYGEIASEEFLVKETKFTFVTLDRNVFEYFVEKPPRNLVCIASVALLDPISGKFSKEEYLNTSLNVSRKVKERFSLLT